MKYLALLPVALVFISPSALALSARTISTEQAQGITGSIITLEVAPGYGLNINLIPTGEVVKKAWIDDPSRIVLSFDGNLCQQVGDQECNNEGATVIHLRQIKPIAFPDLPRSSGGGTLLTLITEGSSEGRKIYQFKVMPVSGQPKYTVLSISPEVEQIYPVIPPASVRQNLPIVKAPNQLPVVGDRSQWSMPTPSRVTVQPNSTNTISNSLPSINSPVFNQQTSQIPNPSINPTIVTSHQEFAQTPIPKSPLTPVILPTVKSPEQNNVDFSRQPTSSSSLATQTRQEEKLISPSSVSSTKLPNNSVPANHRNSESARKVPKRSTPSLAVANNTTVKPVGNSTSNSSLIPIGQANALVRGLVVASRKGHINYRTKTWKQVQSVVLLLRRGIPKQNAATKAGVPLKLIDQLLLWGQV